MKKIDKKIVNEISDLMDKLSISEFEYFDGNEKIKLKKENYIQSLPPKIVENEITKSENKKNDRDSDNSIKAPLVGTVYLSPEPQAKSFIEVGQNVKIGQVLLIIEAMKTMNEVVSHRSGKVKKIFVKNAEPVEFGEPLVLIE